MIKLFPARFVHLFFLWCDALIGINFCWDYKQLQQLFFDLDLYTRIDLSNAGRNPSSGEGRGKEDVHTIRSNGNVTQQRNQRAAQWLCTRVIILGKFRCVWDLVLR